MIVQIFLGAGLGALVGFIPGLFCLFFREQIFWTAKLAFIIVAGTGALIGALAGATEAVLQEFQRSQLFRARDREPRPSRSSDIVP